MLKNYVKIAFRNIVRHKGHSFINITGLAIGMAACLLIMLWVREELSYDRFHENADRIVRLTRSLKSDDGTPEPFIAKVPLPTAQAIVAVRPDIKAVRFFQLFGRTPLITYQNKKFYEEHFFFVDSTIFEVFTFPLVAGDPRSVLNEPYSVLVTEETARRYFGDDNAIGKVITFENGLDYTVTGVVNDLPPTSHIHFDFLASGTGLPGVFEIAGLPASWLNSWYWTACHTYLLLPRGEPVETFRAFLPDFVSRSYPDHMKDRVVMDVQLLTDIHLYSQLEGELEENGDIKYVWILSLTAVLTLLIAFINYINLTTARAGERCREIGIRKTCGAIRGQLTLQFIIESLTMSAIAALIALMTIWLALEFIGNVFGWEAALRPTRDWDLMVYFAAALLAIGIITCGYPALLLSKIRPVDALKRYASSKERGTALRRILIVTQFTVSIVLIISMLTMHNQLSFMRGKDIGFNKDFVVQLPLQGTALRPQIEAFKQKLLANPDISGVCLASSTPGVHYLVNPYVTGESNNRIDLPGFFVDWDFLPMMDIPLLHGRNFSREIPTDTLAQGGGGAFILNETAVAMFGWDDPIGKSMGWYGQPTRGRVVGVVKDFHYAPMNESIGPLVLSVALGWCDRVLVRLRPSNVRQTVDYIVATWDSFVPDRPCEFRFLDAELEQLYRGDKAAGKVLGFFAGLAIMIACLGLVGLALRVAERRTKEIGIRKVLGASTVGVIGLLLREFIVLVALANVVAWPLAYYAVSRWLEHFAYRIETGWEVFVLAGLATSAVAVATVGTITFKAAAANPVDSLKYE